MILLHQTQQVYFLLKPICKVAQLPQIHATRWALYDMIYQASREESERRGRNRGRMRKEKEIKYERDREM